MTLVAAAMGGMAMLGTDTAYWVIAVLLWVGGTGMGWAMTPATASITDSLPAEEQGVASAMNDVAREVGGALGIAVLGSVLSNGYRSALDLNGAPAPVAAAARESVAAATGFPEPIRSMARGAFVDGLGDTLALASALMIVCAVVVACVIGARRRKAAARHTRLVPVDH